MHIDHIVLWVEDARRALDFYTTVVGLAGVRSEEFLAGSAPLPSVRVSDGSILDLTPAMVAQFASHFTGETVGETSFGARGSSKHWFYFQDPDGNVLEARHYD